MSDLHDRAAKALGWSTRDVQSLSMQSLRDLVRPVDANLAREMDFVIQSGAYVRGTPAAKKTPQGRRHATVARTKIWSRKDWKTPGASEPLKYDWEFVRVATIEEVDRWLEIYRHDHPNTVFVASLIKPRAKKGPKIMRGPGSEH